MYIGYVRAARGERLLGNRPSVESDPCKTLREAQEWVATMLASNVEAGKRIAEAGTRRDEKAKIEPEVLHEEEARRLEDERKKAARSRRRSGKGSRNGRADHTPASGENA